MKPSPIIQDQTRRADVAIAVQPRKSLRIAWRSGATIAVRVVGLRERRKAHPRSRVSLRASMFLMGWLLCAMFHDVQAQWVQQQVTLKPGWNAIFLEVDPVPAECDTLFAGLPIESVWDWNPTTESAQFVKDPNTLIPGATGWLTWFPPAHPQASQVNLFILRDGRPYLIKMADNATATTWTITGKPSLRGLRWQVSAVNFVGFRVAAETAPTFATLFAGEAGLSGQPIYRLGTAGVWQLISNPVSTGPMPGEAYWVRCEASATRSGTIEVDSGSRRGLLFGQTAIERSVRIRNTSGGARTVSVRLVPSAIPPLGQPPLAGPAPLEYRDANYAQAQFDWKPLTNTLSFAALAPGAEWNLRLAIRRAGLTTTLAGAEFQSLLEVSDDAGTRWLLPVSAEPSSNLATPGPVPANKGGSSHFATGLWIGEAVINAVSQPAHPSNPLLTRPSGGEFPFRLIMHVDATGSARLLQHVFLVRKPATFKPDPDNPGFNVLDHPARTVAVADESFIPQIVGSGDIIGRRVSSSAFGFAQPVDFTGGLFGAGMLEGTVALEYDHPLNPFQHVYHPDHNNLDERFEQKLPEGQESFTVTRSVSLEFTATDPWGLDPPGWGDTELGGTYRETVEGLHRDAIRVSGHFRLVRVLSVAALNQ